jgi:hypothetical protein
MKDNSLDFQAPTQWPRKQQLSEPTLNGFSPNVFFDVMASDHNGVKLRLYIPAASRRLWSVLGSLQTTTK